MEIGEKRQKRGSGGNNIISLPAPPPPSTPSLFFCSLFFTLTPLFWACSHESGGTRAVHKIPPFKPIAVFLLTFLCTVPTFLGLFTWKWGNPGCPFNPPPPSTPSLFFCSLFFARSLLFWACLHESEGTWAVHLIPPPPQPHRRFSAQFSLRCPHYFGPVYMKVGQPGLSIKSPPPSTLSLFFCSLCAVPTILGLFTCKWGNPGHKIWHFYLITFTW